MFFRRAFLTLLIALYIALFPASASWSPAGARALSLSGCQVTAEDVWSCRNNPAGLGSLSGFRSGAFYESRFLSSGIAAKSVCASASMGKVISLGAGITEFGNNHMKDQTASFTLARSFGVKMNAGASIEWNTLRFSENYGAASALTASFGILLQINSAASFGVAVRNPFRAAYKNSGEPMASILNAGFKWKVSGRTAVFLESEMSPGIPYSLRSGLEYVSAADFSLRLGVSNTYLPVSFGTGFRIRNVVVDLSASYHLQLGTTMSVSLIYSKK